MADSSLTHSLGLPSLTLTRQLSVDEKGSVVYDAMDDVEKRQRRSERLRRTSARVEGSGGSIKAVK